MVHKLLGIKAVNYKVDQWIGVADFQCQTLQLTGPKARMFVNDCVF